MGGRCRRSTARGWWPLNILLTLALATAAIYLLEKDGIAPAVLAIALLAALGTVVEYWWWGAGLCVAAWAFCKAPSVLMMVLWTGLVAMLWVINSSFWALASVSIILAATRVDLRLPRSGQGFYFYYPAHLALL